MVRLDILAVLKDAVQPRRLIRNICLSLVLLIVMPYCLHNIAKVVSLTESLQTLITWYAVSPPIGTTIWMCVFLGFSAPIAMEIVLLTNLLSTIHRAIYGRIVIGYGGATFGDDIVIAAWCDIIWRHFAGSFGKMVAW